MNKLFQRVGNLHPSKSVFNLSYEKKFTCDMGELIPVLCDEAVPGDIWSIGNQIVIRFQPLVAPLLHEINCYVHYFFVPYRLLWDQWEDFITGGVDGTLTPTLPRWEPTDTAVGSLWDYMGMPTGVDPDGAYPMAFPMNAYNLIWNEYYRDETLHTEAALDDEAVLCRCWEKDYFTSALLWQQRGTAPALPVSGTLNAQWAAPVTLEWPALSTGDSDPFLYDQADQHPNNSNTKTALELGVVNNTELEANTIDASGLTTFDVADLRLAFQVQKWLERNARAGARYVEFLGAHFGVHPRDDRLQRPEYIGGSKSPVIISEVLQTSKTDTSPQGNMAGHGIAVDSRFCSKYHVQEFGLIMGIMSVVPRTAYSQGINRQWLRTTKYDFYFPEFANLSEQEIIRAEIYANGVSADNNTLFGYQGRYDEMRCKQSMICGDMRSTYDFWHLGRQFAAFPTLDDTFVTAVPGAGGIRKDIFAAPSVDGLIVSFGNIIKAIRPMPIIAEPGLIDHH